MVRRIFIIGIVALFLISALMSANPGGITVKQTAEKVTVSGDKGKKIASDKFSLSKDGWYIVKIAYTGPKVSVCQLSLVNQSMIDKKETVGGLLTNWIGPGTTEKIRSKGSGNSEDYMIYVEETGGPWTIEILKSPKPAPVSSEKTFSGNTNKVSPFFHMKKGRASFTMNQKLKSQFASRLEINLINADTGEYAANLCHNDTSPTLTSHPDIPADGNYIMEIFGGGDWSVSFTQ